MVNELLLRIILTWLRFQAFVRFLMPNIRE
jgi:hypothetical protein